MLNEIRNWFLSPKDLRDHIRQTKKVYVQGSGGSTVIFHIRRINLEDYASGLDLLYTIWETYKKAPRQENRRNDIEQAKKLRDFMRDFIYAGVASPKLAIKENYDATKETHVNEVLKDMELASNLCTAIIDYSRGKKKPSTKKYR